MVERSSGAEPEGSRNKVEKEGGRQKWEYHAAWIFRDGKYEIPTGEKAMFGGDKTKKVPMWVGDLPGGDKLPLGKFLQEMGENGWEITGVAQSQAPSGGGIVNWYYPDHWLYFKRPKIDNLPPKVK